jgi:serine/threonine-protein kinase
VAADSFDPTRTSVHAERLAPRDEGRFLPGTVIADRYRIYGLLGRGGMGEVYRADDLKLGQAVALKFLPQDFERDEARRSRFLNEVRVARQISHGNVCRVYDVGEVDGRQFISMEYVDGEDLAVLLSRIGHLPKEKAVQIARQLCAGLAAAHEQGVLHRDLKPANVMIDGRGRAKITDFGLAALASDDRDAGAGTPTYMAPEQLAGGPASVKSDLYSLGLVLYELFTGKRPFLASTTEELARLQRESTPTSPSSHVDGFDPAVERAILKCLRTDPRERPDRALAVAASLPGGDPLAAALAAGETPSPELVAEAGAVGGIRPQVAWSVVSAIVALAIVVALLSGRTQLVGLVALDKSPDVLAERGKTLLATLGYADPAADTAWGFHADTGFLDYVLEHDRSWGRWDRLAVGRPPAIRFWYRQGSPNLLSAQATLLETNFYDPPRNNPGMVTAFLDTRGRLARFEAARSELDDTSGEAPEPDWSVLFEEAGLDASSLKTAPPRWIPTVFADRRAAWEGASAEAPDIPIRVEAAAYHGRPVYFRIVYPWTQPAAAPSEEASLTAKIMAATASLILIAVLVGAVFLARRNVRLGRGDRKGAFRLAAFVFTVGWIAGILGGHYVASLDEVDHLILFTAIPLFIAGVVFVFYLALEPHLRRLWPETIVSWVRLLDGRFTDPLVGRDVLIGVLFGVITRLVDQSYQLSAQALGITARVSDVSGGPGIDQILFGFTSARHALSNLVAFMGASLLFNLGYLVLLLLCRVILRRTWAAIGVFVVLMTVTTGLPANIDPSGLIVYMVVALTVWLVALYRFGLLTVAVGQFVALALTCFPLTTDAAAWYSGRTLLVLAVVGALAAYGFRVATAARPSIQRAR